MIQQGKFEMKYAYNNAISIVIPVYNEEGSITQLLEEITNSIPDDIKYEIIVIDDASQDNTWNQVTSFQHKVNCLQGLQHAINLGQTAALFTGIKNARYNWIISMDGDGQNDPKDISRLIDTMKNQPHYENGTLIAGHRIERKDSPLKKASSKIANKIRRAILNDNCNDTGCSLKLFPKDAVLSLPQFNHFHRFIPAMLDTIGIDTVNIEVNHRNREFGVSKYGLNNRLWVGIADMFGVRWLKKRYIHPTKITESKHSVREE